MNCSKVERLLGEDLTAATRAEVRRHMKECLNCHALYEELESIEELAQTLNGGRGAPMDFSNHVFQQIETGGGRWRPAAAMGCLAVAALAFLYNSSPGESRPHAQAPSRVEVLEVLTDPIEWPVPAGGPVVRELGDPAYVERIFQHPSKPDYILRLPSTIRIRKDDLPPDAYVSHVSH